MMYSLAFTSLQYLIFITSVFAHTWVETVNLVGSDGSFQKTGFPRGFGGRQAGVDPDKTNTYLLPPNGRSAGNEILPTDLICKDTQVNQVQSAGHPRLSASPNDRVSLAYHENGHVTKFDTTDGKPEGRGTVFIYGTNNASPKDTFLGIHRIWNEDGTGGDKRGKLLATRPFDDGQCYQPNSEITAQTRAKALGFASAAESPEVLCQTVVQLPSDARNNGTYTLYWVWDWPTLDQAGNVFKNESYSSCIDINMQSKSNSQPSQFTSANKVNGDQVNKTCEQNDKIKQVSSKIVSSNKSSKSNNSQEKVSEEEIDTKKEALDNIIKNKEFKGEEDTGKSPITECKANREDNLIKGNTSGSKLDEGKAFSATGVITTKGGKDKANTVAVKDQLESKSQIMIDPKASPKIASDNPPKQPASTISTLKGNKNSTKNATPPNQILQKVKEEKVASEHRKDGEGGEEKKGENKKNGEGDEDKEVLPSKSLPISDSTISSLKGNQNATKNATQLNQILQKVKEEKATSEHRKNEGDRDNGEGEESKEDKQEKKEKNEDGDEDKEVLPSNSLPISDSTEKGNKNQAENLTSPNEIYHKIKIKVFTPEVGDDNLLADDTSKEDEDLTSNALPISRVMRNKVYIFTGNNSNVDLVRTITLPK